MWLTTKDGRRVNTEWFDEDERRKYAQIEANEKQAQELMGKKAYDPLEKSPSELWEEGNLSLRKEINKQYSQHKIDKEKMKEIRTKMDESVIKIVKYMFNHAGENNLKALHNTMLRKDILTSDRNISGNATLYKTVNGFVLQADGARGNFRMFMDNEGRTRRMPDNEMKTKHSEYSLGSIAHIDDVFDEAYYRYKHYVDKKSNN